MTIDSVSYTSRIKAIETLAEAGSPAATPEARKVTHNLFDAEGTITATAVAYFEKALTAGAGTIDFTVLPNNGLTVDGTGLKVKAIRFKADPDNAGPIAITEHETNGLDLGAQISALAAGAEIALRGNDAVIGSGAKVLELAGTGTDHLEVTVILGA